MDKSRSIPISQRMCATLHRNSTSTAHGAPQLPLLVPWRGHSAIRPDGGSETV
jgi:hypothetical protein